ncbi:unnamed protein product [Caenorhabditis brenneri]
MFSNYFLLLIFFCIMNFSVYSEAMGADKHFRRGQRPKCKTATVCKDWCLELDELDAIPRCFQHRCWCTTLDSPMNKPSSYLIATSTTEEPLPEASGSYEPSSQTKQEPLKVIQTFFNAFMLILPNLENSENSF